MRFSALAPTDVRDYAKSLGWSLLQEALPDRLYVLTHPEMSPRQIVIPIETSAPDYAEAVQTVREDTLRYRVTTARRDEDTLPLPFAASLVQGAQQMLLASACTVLTPRLHHPRLYRAEAQQLVENARFGQTEQGSFVLEVSCPIDALDVQGSLPWDDVPLPFVRMATNRCCRPIFVKR